MFQIKFSPVCEELNYGGKIGFCLKAKGPNSNNSVEVMVHHMHPDLFQLMNCTVIRHHTSVVVNARMASGKAFYAKLKAYTLLQGRTLTHFFHLTSAKEKITA